ncbi:hypothetical protein [Agriterribacter sp.]|uniref:hypothetical protein n=1 Tax=Agriterribacter sp. TaxID=2821509 RepID=UPI002CEB04D3|nr:hypothetical protein [Agriterribacter sp.]HTN09039.1 hypothetical protein [Agriterribacter sp.]
MDKFNFEFFEFVGAVIPGIPLFILSSFLISHAPYSFEVLALSIKNASLGEVTIAILSCYCIGFCLHHPAFELFQPLIKKFWKKELEGFPVSIGEREKELVEIRQKSPNNFKIISKFLALRQMSYCMFFSLLICFFAFLIAMLFCKDYNRDILSGILLSLIFGFLFLRRSVAFHQRIQKMISISFEHVNEPRTLH